MFAIIQVIGFVSPFRVHTGGILGIVVAPASSVRDGYRK